MLLMMERNKLNNKIINKNNMSLELVKKLREVSGAGIVDCQRALKEAGDDFDKAIEILRKNGQQIVNKTADRIAKEGVIVFYSTENNRAGAIVEVGCETDFVARNEDFLKYANIVAKATCENNVNTIEELMDSLIDGKKLIEYQNEIIAKIKEKIEVKRFARRTVDNGVIGSYIHFDKRSGCLLVISNVEDNSKTMSIIKDLGMHIVALKPQYLSKDDVPDDIIKKEKEILLNQPDLKNKPAEIAEKIVQGRINKFYSENCLIEQLFVKDDSKTVKQVVEGLGKNARIESFVLYELAAQ